MLFSGLFRFFHSTILHNDTSIMISLPFRIRDIVAIVATAANVPIRLYRYIEILFNHVLFIYFLPFSVCLTLSTR